MEQRTLEERVENLEKMMATLEDLPGQIKSVEGRLGEIEGRLGSVEGRLTSVESQIVQLGSRMDDGFSALRDEIRTGDERTRTELRSELQRDSLKLAEMIDERFAETNREMRVLHEKLVKDIRSLGEGRA
jgi:predicted  nucleic acid-binding Zn-ribbon protein